MPGKEWKSVQGFSATPLLSSPLHLFLLYLFLLAAVSELPQQVYMGLRVPFARTPYRDLELTADWFI